eukprot:comp9626_c0_seq1/m.11164 comp9626_c0_seq1/g.11164  ORF comp9626_c0_seq1/g.11164 comp9626_c0_seq1/m.11164 type:complete len:334 (+) comp9626_c0_seq1:2218-3219(+)
MHAVVGHGNRCNSVVADHSVGDRRHGTEHGGRGDVLGNFVGGRCGARRVEPAALDQAAVDEPGSRECHGRHVLVGASGLVVLVHIALVLEEGNIRLRGSDGDRIEQRVRVCRGKVVGATVERQPREHGSGGRLAVDRECDRRCADKSAVDNGCAERHSDLERGGRGEEVGTGDGHCESRGREGPGARGHGRHKDWHVDHELHVVRCVRRRVRRDLHGDRLAGRGDGWRSADHGAGREDCDTWGRVFVAELAVGARTGVRADVCAKERDQRAARGRGVCREESRDGRGREDGECSRRCLCVVETVVGVVDGDLEAVDGRVDSERRKGRRDADHG